MRPIKLEIEGLQSFKEKQVINFDKLSEFGLFGIFGETGSGKSTILDAMIYGIYNKIPRMMGTTDKIEESFNLESDVMRIRFEFALGKDIYIVERGMKRAKGIKLFSTLTPILIKNNKVVAEKTKEIDAIIMEDFGIDVNDFTRSVILPQGKFSEFLKLTGQNKLLMLENIFSLEQYGDSLRDKVSKEKKKWEKEIQSLKDRALGKGMVTEEEIEETNNNLKKLKHNKERLEQDRIEYDALYKSIENLKNYLDEKKILDIKIKELKLEEKNILNLEEEIKNLKEISKFTNILSERKDKLTSELKIKKQLVVLEERKKIMDLEFEKLNKLIKLEESKINNIDEKLKKINYNSELLGELKDNISRKEKLNIYTSKVDELSKELQENESEKLQCEINWKSINNDLEEKKNKKILEDKDKITEKELKELSEKIFILTQDILFIKKNEKNLDDLLKNKPKNILKLEETKKNLEMKLIAEKDLENKILGNRASIFSSKLKKGSPCPVCGSKEHPHKAEFDEEAENILKELKEEIIKLREQGTQIESKKKRDEEDILKLESEIEKCLEKLERDEIEKLIQNKEKLNKRFLLSEKLEIKVELLKKNYEKLFLKYKSTEEKIKELSNEIIKLERDKEFNIKEKNRVDLVNKTLKNNLFLSLEEMKEIDLKINI
ncbi:MAG: hypothetical protein ACRCVS_02980, partial [Fusobacteriaceae bacterium]